MHRCLLKFLLCSAVTVAAPLTAQVAFEMPEQIATFVEINCLDCHGGDVTKGKFDLTVTPKSRVDQLWRWSRMRDRLHSFEMPPVEDSEVTVEEREQFVAWVDGLLEREVRLLPSDPGEVTVRRLSRGHWRNTVQDLFGVAVDTAGFPADDLGYGFDSVGDALTFSTLHLEKYLAASREVAEAVFHGEDPANPKRRLFNMDAIRVASKRGIPISGGVARLNTNGTIEQSFALARTGRYQFRVAASATQAGAEPAKMLLELDGRRLDVLDVANQQPRDFIHEAEVRGGRHKLSLSFINDFYDPKNPDPKRRDRNLKIGGLEIIGPIDVRVVPEQQQWLRASLSGRTEAARLDRLIRPLLTKVWRRSITSEECNRLRQAGIRRLKSGESLLDVQRFVLTAALTSPNFLFRIERRAQSDTAESLGADELAARLSYFLWASAPDDRLRAAARGGKLLQPDNLAIQVDRLLQDKRANRLATDFAAQWFELRSLADRTPDPDRFGRFDDELRRAFRRESELLFLAVQREGRDVRALLDCDFTHVNKRLAEFYGLPHSGNEDVFLRTRLTGDAVLRGGLLGHASVHAITSNPTRTSPVKRGKWLLENLLGQAPPPPPPGNDSFADEDAIDDSATLRQQMAQHRDNSKCAVCHVRMDALGLAMERFDAVGKFRRSDRAGVIDASGELPDGRQLDGLVSLKKLLASDPAFVRTFMHKLFVYAIGRDLRPIDRLRINLEVRRLLELDQITMRDLIMAIVRDPAFSRRIRSE